MLTTSVKFSRCALKGKQGVPKARCKSLDVTNRLQEDPESDKALKEAKQRLHRLLSGVRGQEAELLDQALQELPREEVMIAFAQVAGTVVIGSFALSIVCGVDPLGGFNLTHPEVNHLMCGIGAASPLIFVRLLLQSKQMPSFIQEYQTRRDDEVLRLIRHLSQSDALLVATMLSISVSFFLFPGLVGSISASVKSWFSFAFGPGGNGHTFEGALLLVAGLVGVLSGTGLCLDPEEAEVVMEAVKNSDRYYRLTNSSSGGPHSAYRQSEAFRQASKQLLEDNKNACIFGSVLTFLEIFYGGMIWKMTGDASASICLFLCLALMQTIQLKSAS